MSNSRWTHLVGAVDVNFRLDDGHEPAADHARRDVELLRHDRFDTDRVVPSNHAPSLGAENAVAGASIGSGNALLNAVIRIARTEIKINVPSRRRYRAPP